MLGLLFPTWGCQAKSGHVKSGRAKQRGQNLVEFALTLPFLIILLFGMVEFSRAWQAWHGAKMAADDGCYTAAVYKDGSLGQQTMQARAAKSKLNFSSASVKEIKNAAATVTIGYECDITVRHFPLWTGLGIHVPGFGHLALFEEGIPINYQQDYFRGVF